MPDSDVPPSFVSWLPVVAVIAVESGYRVVVFASVVVFSEKKT